MGLIIAILNLSTDRIQMSLSKGFTSRSHHTVFPYSGYNYSSELEGRPSPSYNRASCNAKRHRIPEDPSPVSCLGSGGEPYEILCQVYFYTCVIIMSGQKSYLCSNGQETEVLEVQSKMMMKNLMMMYIHSNGNK